MKWAGILLCGGASRRMGLPKNSLIWRGETLLHRGLAALAPCASERMVSAAPEQELPALPAGVRRVNDPRSGCGPLMGLSTALAVAQEIGCDAAIVLAVDMPLVTTALLYEMMEALGPHDEAVVPRAGGRRQPLCAVYRTRIVSVAQSVLDRGDSSVQALLDLAAHRILDIDASSRGDLRKDWFRSMNTPDDIAWLNGVYGQDPCVGEGPQARG